MISGALVVDKPQGWTSHDVVNKIRRIAGERSVGHLGTLDPLATGVLPLLLGSATRLARFYTRAQKTYEAVVQFGYATNTYDADGEPASEPLQVSLDAASLERALSAFRGTIQQIPPAHSAKKIGGVPAYKLARKNKPVDLAPVEIEITALEILKMDRDRATLRIQSSAGCYVRSIAHDLGQALGCGAHLAALRRTRSGDFTIEQARSIPELEQCRADDRLMECIVPAGELLPDFPSVRTDSLTALQIRNGRNFHTSPFLVQSGAKFVRVLTEEGALLAIGEAVLPNVYHPVIVMAD